MRSRPASPPEVQVHQQVWPVRIHTLSPAGALRPLGNPFSALTDEDLL